MFLSFHAFERLALRIPNLSNIKNHLWLPVTLFRLVWLKQEYGWSTDSRCRAFAAVCLRHDACFLSEPGCLRVIKIVGIFEGMRQHPLRSNGLVNVCQPLHIVDCRSHRVVAEV